MYQKPVMRVVNIRTVSLLSGSPQVQTLSGNGNLNLGGAGSGPARGRQGRVWEDDEDWDD